MPVIHHLRKEQIVATDLPTAWDFMRSPANLDRITPPDMRFEIVTDLPEEMYNGLLIEYRIGIPLIGKRTWLTEIKHVRDGRSFVDEQRAGPYKFWFHHHEIAPHPDGVLFSDHITYSLPMGPLGGIANYFYVRNQLEYVFEFRREAMERILGSGQ